MQFNTIYNEDCFVTMANLPTACIDIVLTSPFYNTNVKAGKHSTLLNTTAKMAKIGNVRYDSFVDVMTNDDYCDFTIRLFNSYDKILKPNGVVLYNISYGAENTEGMFRAINDVVVRTNFTIADCLVWKKKSAFPNDRSRNKLTRITEFVFVFCRKSELDSYYCKNPTALNIIEARNNDGTCPLNKATYSTDLCNQLLDIYAPENAVVYDSFIGSGTTAISCIQKGITYVGSEISDKQVRWANERINKLKNLNIIEDF